MTHVDFQVNVMLQAVHLATHLISPPKNEELLNLDYLFRGFRGMFKFLKLPLNPSLNLDFSSCNHLISHQIYADAQAENFHRARI